MLATDIVYRMMSREDVGAVPIDCQGSPEDVHARIEDLGSCAVLGFYQGRHVAQLQFRRYDPEARSSNSIWDPCYWGDFGSFAPDLPYESLSVHCYHVGQTAAGDERESAYQGLGVGNAMLSFFLGWAIEKRFRACVAKGTPPVRSVQMFMGGQSTEAYLRQGFERLADWVDMDLDLAVRSRGLVSSDMPALLASTVSCCVIALESGSSI